MGVLTRSQAVTAKDHKLPVTLLSGFLGAGDKFHITSLECCLDSLCFKFG